MKMCVCVCLMFGQQGVKSCCHLHLEKKMEQFTKHMISIATQSEANNV